MHVRGKAKLKLILSVAFFPVHSVLDSAINTNWVVEYFH